MTNGSVIWSNEVHEADWIGERLATRAACVAAVVPSGFESYARILHPVETPHDGEELVRWRDLAAWSGQSLESDTPFHSIALPPHQPEQPPPSIHSPSLGRLYLPDAGTLASVIRRFTTTASDCWFGLWDGYDLVGVPLAARVGARRGTGPIPELARNGQRVHLSDRDYLLYRGGVDSFRPFESDSLEQTANLWWPGDHAWCVASEVDLSSTYVGGSSEMIGVLLAEPALEALPSTADDRLSYVASWLLDLVKRSGRELLRDGKSRLETSRGVLNAKLHRAAILRQRELVIEAVGGNRRRLTSRTPFGHLGEVELRRQVEFQLTRMLIGLVGD